MHAIVTAKVVPPSSVRPTLPPDFDELVMRALHRDPAKRFASLDEMGSALLSLADTASIVQWEDVFLAGDQERSPWMVPGKTLNDSDAVLVPGLRRTKRVRQVSASGWGFVAMSCVAVPRHLPSRRLHDSLSAARGRAGAVSRVARLLLRMDPQVVAN